MDGSWLRHDRSPIDARRSQMLLLVDAVLSRSETEATQLFSVKTSETLVIL
jgi:hypothetical protein